MVRSMGAGFDSRGQSGDTNPPVQGGASGDALFAHPLIHAPATELLTAALLTHSPRVEYVATQPRAFGNFWQEGRTGEITIEQCFGGGRRAEHGFTAAFEHLIFPNLKPLLARDFGTEQKLLLRGCTINLGPEFEIPGRGGYEPTVLKSLARVLETGTELSPPAMGAPFTRLIAYSHSDTIIESHSLSYLVRGVQDLRQRAPSPQNEQLFPAIFIYANLPFQRRDQYALPSDPAEQRTAIRKLFILDFLGPI